MAIASGLLVSMVGAAFAVLLLAIEDMRSSARLATHSRAELTAAGRLESLVLNLETGERGYVITRKERFLTPWTTALRTYPQQERRLRRIIDDAGQARLERRIAESVNSYIRDYSIPLVNAARRGDDSARSVATTAAGKRRVDRIRAMFDRYVAVERDLASERQAAANTDARRAVIAAAIGLAGSVLLIVLFAGYLTRSIVLPVRRAALMAGRLAGGDLGVRMPETGAGEIGALERAFNTMGGSLEAGRDELQLLLAEQAALRRVATLVARGGSADEVFAAVAAEVRTLLGADSTALLRYKPDATATVVAGPGEADAEVAVGTRWPLEGEDVAASVLNTGRAVRTDSVGDASGPVAALLPEHRVRSAVGAPIVVEGRLWGVMIAAWTEPDQLPADTESRMAEFTELLATAIANADTQAELAASRARVVAAADESRRRIERDLHDGTQQRLVSLGLELRAAEAMVPPQLDDLKEKVSHTADGLADAVEDLQEISRGIHPAILSRGGLGPALRALARRSALPVELEIDAERRLPAQVEVASYYVVSEALNNAAKHAQASAIQVDIHEDDAILELAIRDDGAGGADLGKGSGLIGLRDRVEALGGQLEIASPVGRGTSLRVRLPLRDGG
jgi:signal transduction histidine kinase